MRLSSIAFILLLFSFVQCQQEAEEPFVPVNHFVEIETVDYYGTFNQFIKLSNGDYLICGGATFGNEQPGKMLMFSIDSDHHLLQKRTYQIENYINPSALSVCEIDASTYMIAAKLYKETDTNYYDGFVGIMEMDADGILSTPIYTIPIGAHTMVDWARILKDGAGGYYFAFIESATMEYKSSLIVKNFNSDHEEQWSIKVEDIHWQPDMHIASNGDILIAGSSYPEEGNIQNRELTAARINPSGQVIYKKSFGGPATWDCGFSVVESFDGGSIVSGQLAYTNTPVLFSLDKDGIVGKNVVLNDTMYIYKNEVQKLSSGYLVTNVFRRGDNDSSVNLIMLNNDLQKRWSYILEMPSADYHPVFLINSITEPNGSVSIAMEDGDILKILSTVPL